MHHLYPLQPATVGLPPVVVAAALRACRHALTAAWIRRQRRRRTQATCVALGGLDDRALHDLGIERQEIASVAAGLAGSAERTRRCRTRSARERHA